MMMLYISQMTREEGYFHLTLTLIQRVDARCLAAATRGHSDTATKNNELAVRGVSLAEEWLELHHSRDVESLESWSAKFHSNMERYKKFKRACEE